MIMPVSMAAAQLKWIRCKQSTTLLDFHNLEQASRDPLGAFASLTAARAPLSVLGPTVVFLSLGFEAFTQQSVQVILPDSVSVMTGLSMLNISGWSHKDPIEYSTRRLVAAFNGMDPGGSSSYLYQSETTGCDVSYLLDAPEFTETSCSQAMCAPTRPYFTLELCAECWDLSNRLQEDCSDHGNWYKDICPRKLPSGLFAVANYLLASKSYTSSPYGYVSPCAETIAWIETVSVVEPNQYLRDYFEAPYPVNASFAAQTCAIGLCTTVYQLQAYTDRYEKHQVEHQLFQGPRSANGSHGVPLKGTNSSYTFNVDPGAGEYDLANGDLLDKVTVEEETLEVLQDMALLLFSRATMNMNGTLENLWFQSRSDQIAAKLHGSYYQSVVDAFTPGPWQLCDSFQVTLNAVLADMSRYLRSSFGRLLSVDRGGPNEAQPGRLGPYYEVRWQWLTLPLVLEVAGICFFLSVVWLSRKHRLPLWKSSTLATLYHGIDLRQHPEGVMMESIDDMECTAKETRIRLAYTTTGYRLVAMDKDF